MAVSHDPRNNDRLVSLRARFEEAVDKMIGDSEWHGANLTAVAESARCRLDELIEADFGPKYDGNYIEPVETCTEIALQLYLRAWLVRLSADTSTNRSGITESSVRSMISRISSELADYAAEKKRHALQDDETPEDADIDSVG